MLYEPNFDDTCVCCNHAYRSHWETVDGVRSGCLGIDDPCFCPVFAISLKTLKACQKKEEKRNLSTPISTTQHDETSAPLRTSYRYGVKEGAPEVFNAQLIRFDTPATHDTAPSFSFDTRNAAGFYFELNRLACDTLLDEAKLTGEDASAVVAKILVHYFGVLAINRQLDEKKAERLSYVEN